ncbi:RICIN domain-containing protein [Streptomyces sp. FXJ1.172]
MPGRARRLRQRDAATDQWTCNEQSNQQFQFVRAAGGHGQLRARNSGQLVALSGSSTAAGTPEIVQQAPGGAANSLRLPLQQSDGSYAIRNQGSGLCLDVHGGGRDPGRQLDEWPRKDAAGTNRNFVPR